MLNLDYHSSSSKSKISIKSKQQNSLHNDQSIKSKRNKHLVIKIIQIILRKWSY